MTQAIRAKLPIKRDWNIYQGQTWNRSIVRLDANKTPIDLSDWKARMVIRNGKNGPLLFQLTEEDGITITGEIGLVSWALSREQTESVPITQADYDLFLISPDESLAYPILYGKLIFTPYVPPEESE